jgi:two-component system NtrC family sensor kinase
MNQFSGRVLVIDDDDGLRNLCMQALQRSGYAVSTAANAETALERLATQPFDLVLLDIVMPDMDGLSLLERIRFYNISVPILVISGMVTVEQAARAMRLGAQGLIIKPFTPSELREIAGEIVQKRRAARAEDRIAALRPIIQISQRLLTEFDQSRLYDLIIDTVRSELEAERASLMLLESEGEQLRIVASFGIAEEQTVNQETPVKGSLAGWVATNHRPLRIDASGSVTPNIETLHHIAVHEQVATALSVPVMAGERLLGVLNAAKVSAGPPFTDADQELLLLLADQAAIAIENARLYQRVAFFEERNRILLRHASDAVLLLDAPGTTILDANLAVERLSGYERRELRRLAPQQVLPAIADLASTAGHARSAEHAGTEHREIETTLLARDGQSTPVAVSVSAVTHAGQALLLVIARDISERQRIARQLVQTEKLAAMGRLAASMAHEINNPLQAIYNAVQLLINRGLPEEKRNQYITMSRDEIERLISIVQRMLDFSRPSRDGMRPIDASELIDGLIRLTENQLRQQQIVVERECGENLPRIFANSSHIKHACLSLIFNAIEAMPSGGTLTVRTFLDEHPANDTEDYLVIAGERPMNGYTQPMVCLEIRDTGPGIALHDLPKIFEPFYTTRMKGSGLGLAVSYSIIEQHQGDLSVHSEIGQGTTFRIRLPISIEPID